MNTTPPPAPNRPEVLVVDDEEDIRDVVKFALEGAGYHVAEAVHGRHALNVIGRLQPAIVLLDLNMPVMNGWQFLAGLAELGLTIPVIIMTAGQRACQEAEKHHAAGCLPKPFDIHQLVAVVERFVRPAL